jgi:aminobenzoyl-glutamate utilization protein A
MVDYAQRILEAAAAMHGCDLELRPMGGAQSAESDAELTEIVEEIVAVTEGLTLGAAESGGGSEDFTYMMARVQEHGGKATNIGIGADLGGWGHHTPEFDFDERALKIAVELLSLVTLDLASS